MDCQKSCLPIQIFLIGTLLLLAISWHQEWLSLFNHDSGVILDTSRRIFGGERLYEDIPEVNPPLIFILGGVIVRLSQVTGLDEIFVWRFCHLFFITLIVFFSGQLMRMNGWELTQRKYQGFFWAIIALFFCYPDVDFSQREHSAAVCFLPYLLICARRACKEPVAPKSALIAGIIAGLAFSLKPFFLLVFCLVEIYTWGALRGYEQSWLRLENSMFLLMSGGFLLWTIAGTPYLSFIRFIQPHYASYNSPISILLYNFNFLPFVLASFLHVIFAPSKNDARLRQLLFITALGFTVSYVIQMKGFSYHSLPARIFSWLLVSIIILDLVSLQTCLKNAIRPLAYQFSIHFYVFPVIFIVFSGLTNLYFRNESLEQFTEQIRELGEGKKVQLLTFSVAPAFPAFTYCGLQTTQRGSTPILANFYRGKDTFSGPFPYKTGSEPWELLQSYIDTTVEDIETRKPDYIMSDDRLSRQAIGLSRFNFIEFLMLDERFRQLFKNYQPMKEVSGFKIFKRNTE